MKTMVISLTNGQTIYIKEPSDDLWYKAINPVGIDTDGRLFVTAGVGCEEILMTNNPRQSKIETVYIAHRAIAAVRLVSSTSQGRD